MPRNKSGAHDMNDPAKIPRHFKEGYMANRRQTKKKFEVAL
jgi:hypothetical protein